MERPTKIGRKSKYDKEMDEYVDYLEERVETLSDRVEDLAELLQDEHIKHREIGRLYVRVEAEKDFLKEMFAREVLREQIKRGEL